MDYEVYYYVTGHHVLDLEPIRIMGSGAMALYGKTLDVQCIMAGPYSFITEALNVADGLSRLAQVRLAAVLLTKEDK